MRKRFALLSIGLAIGAIAGCSSSTDGGATGEGGSSGSSGSSGSAACTQGTVPPAPTPADDASSAWPGQGSKPPVITREQVLSACAGWVGCFPATASSLGQISECARWTLWSLERAIALTQLTTAPPGFASGALNQRAETFVSCIAMAGDDCAKVQACTSERPDIYCEEGGCKPQSEGPVAVSCSGGVATVTVACGKPAKRDCAAGGFSCDAASPTGCNDRPITTCTPAEDHCDGDVRLGCDGQHHTSYRDCARLEGGHCQKQADGSSDCAFVLPGGTTCGSSGREVSDPECSGGKLRACVYGYATEVAAPPSLCPP